MADRIELQLIRSRFDTETPSNQCLAFQLIFLVPQVINYFRENNIDKFDFSIVPSKASSLNSVSETLVKQVKSLIYKSIGSNILNYYDWEFLIEK